MGLIKISRRKKSLLKCDWEDFFFVRTTRPDVVICRSLFRNRKGSMFDKKEFVRREEEKHEKYLQVILLDSETI